jgi:hypothetical protein
MDKFLVKMESETPAVATTPGLELLANPLRHKKRHDAPESEPDYGTLTPQLYEQNIERFRVLMSQRIAEFRPHSYRDPIDYMVEAIWFHFLFHDVTPATQPAVVAEYKQERDNSDIDLISNIH